MYVIQLYIELIFFTETHTNENAEKSKEVKLSNNGKHNNRKLVFCVINRGLLFSSLAVFLPSPLSFSMSALLFLSIVCCQSNSSFYRSIPLAKILCRVTQ